jgi:outer membrane protein assembly factor BamA
MVTLLSILLLGIPRDTTKKESFLLPVPVVCSNPTAGFIYGAGLNYTYREPSARYLSVVSSNATWSTNEMLNLNVKTNLFIGSGRWLINTDSRLQDNTETTFGLGTGKPAAFDLHWNGLSTTFNSNGQALHYQQIRFHQTLSRLLAPNFFAGLGYCYDHYQHISDDKTKAGDSLASYQVQYSESHGFSPAHYTVSGVCINALYDNRDNEVDAYTGYYININYQFNTASQTLLIDYRSYYPLGSNNKNILAFWVYSQLLTSGKLPYLALPAIGYDQRQRSGRGYAFGRFRGEDLLYEESEYRFPVLGRLGGVLFLNLTSTADKTNHLNLGETFQAGYGGGLRFMLDRAMRSRLQLDIGAGKQSLGLYFGIQETF